MPSNDQRIPIPGTRIAARVIDGQALLLDPKATELRRLNPVGSFIWAQVMERQWSVSEIHAAIVENFEIKSSVALTDLTGFLEKLEAEGLITYKTD